MPSACQFVENLFGRLDHNHYCYNLLMSTAQQTNERKKVKIDGDKPRFHLRTKTERKGTIMTDTNPTYQRKSNKRRKQRRVIEVWNGNELVSVDEDDYEVFEFLRSASERRPKGVSPCRIPYEDCPIEYTTDGDEKRICRLKISSRNFSVGLLDKVSSLSALKEFHARISSLDSLPSSIGSWQNLEVLDLSLNYLLHLPKEIGNLLNLRKLDLSFNVISWLPASVGNLLNLRQLNLGDNKISLLPASVGNLQKLTHLNIKSRETVEVPEEFWNLASLQYLEASDLRLSPSIERLQNLESLIINVKREIPNELFNLVNLTDLELNYVEEFFLPTEIGNLASLMSLTICTIRGDPNSNIQFPSSITNLHDLESIFFDLRNLERGCDLQQLNFLMKLPKLETLRLDLDHVTEDLYDFLKDLIQATPSLVDVGSLENNRPDIAYALSRNRFKQNNPFDCWSQASSHLVNKLWPKMLSNAIWAFETDEWESAQPTDPHDAVYRLLVAGRDSFHQTLLHRRSKKGCNLVSLQIGDRDVIIDEYDHCLYENLSSKVPDPSAIEFHVEGNDRRICYLGVKGESFHDPPDEIFSLSALNRLDIEFSDFHEYDFSSIGLLQNLEVLHIFSGELVELPRNIGTLVNLKTLYLKGNLLETLPSSIGDLKSLEELDVSDNGLRYLPHEIGGLKNLKKLDLSENEQLRLLPRSIGNLKGLEYLSFYDTGIIEEFQDEIWELSGLRTLKGGMGTRVIVPPAIGRLHNLQELMLGIKGNLPEEFGNLTNLKELHLMVYEHPFRLMLPQSMAKLRNLKEIWLLTGNDSLDIDMRQLDFIRRLPKLEYIYLDANPQYWPHDASEYMANLIQATPSLTCMRSFMQFSMPEVSYAISCNCFKSRTPFRYSEKDTSPIVNKLWPLMLSNASRAFKWTRGCYDGDRIKPHDAVYKILKDGRGSFLQVLLDRSHNGSGEEGGEIN